MVGRATSLRRLRVNQASAPRLSLAGRHALITGGARGIGAAIADRLHALGAAITIMGRDESRLRAHAKTLPGSHYEVVDVSKPDAVIHAFDQVRQRAAPVDILVNNAGVARSAPFEKTEQALWQQILAVNLSGVFWCQQQVLGAMRESGWGRIINIVSTAGLTGYAYVAAYCAAKHGAIGLTRALALETARDGITVNAVCPGFTETDLLEESLKNIMATTGRSREQAEKSLKSVNPQHRFIQPQEVAHTVAWLCLPGSEGVTGQSIAVAGGEVM